MSRTIKEALGDAEAVIVGIGSEMSTDIKKVIEKNNVYKAIGKTVDRLLASGDLDGDSVKFIEGSIYYNELTSGRNQEILHHIDTYERLLKIIKEKNYFIVTTCIDDIIYQSGFDKEKIVAPCGSITRLQYNCGCPESVESRGISEASQVFEGIYAALSDMKQKADADSIISLMPKCRQCSTRLSFNIHRGTGYNENGYLPYWDNYTKWLQRTLNKKLVLLELGAGFSTPEVIRWPFEKIAMVNYKAMLYRVNGKFPQMPEEMREKGVSIKENAYAYINNNF